MMIKMISFFFLVSSLNLFNPLHKTIDVNNYFPKPFNKVLVYQTNIGETESRHIEVDNLIIAKNESDRFKYYQKLFVNETGAYVVETYQYVKLFFFLNKENTYSYNKPLLRLPQPPTPGKTWHWEGIEYNGKDSSTISVTGSVICNEIVSIKAGTFETIKVETIVRSPSGSRNIIKEWYSENIGLVKANIIIEGGGMMGLIRDVLGYGEIDFELKEIRGL